MVKSIKFLAGFIPAVATILFAYILYANGVPLSLATWSLILILDGLALWLVYKGSGEVSTLLLSWTFAATCVVIAIIATGGRFMFSTIEVMTFALTLIAVWQWLRSGRPVVGLRWQAVAMWVSSIPMFHDFWVSPQVWTWWLWATTLICCIIDILTTGDKEEIKILVQLSAIGLNAVMLILLIL